MRNNENNLGAIIKSARVGKGLTQEKLAEKVDIGIRHMMSIENEGKTPSFKVLYSLIRELHIPADSIFYPERVSNNPQIDELVYMLNDCDERSLKIITATVRTALDTQSKD